MVSGLTPPPLTTSVHAVVQQTDSSNSQSDFGLKNRDSSKERLDKIQGAVQRVSDNAKIPSHDSSADYGLQDRSTVPERVDVIRNLNTKIVETTGFNATRDLVEKFVHNTKIDNQWGRNGTVVDISV